MQGVQTIRHQVETTTEHHKYFPCENAIKLNAVGKRSCFGGLVGGWLTLDEQLLLLQQLVQLDQGV